MEKIRNFSIIKYERGELRKEFSDMVAVEQPLEIFIDDIPYILTMRLPGDDFDLVRGILFSNGIIENIHEIKGIRYCEDSENRIHVELSKEYSFRERKVHESFSSCGICGKLDVQDIFMEIPRVNHFSQLSSEALADGMKDLEKRMELFERTGCVHAVSIYSTELSLISYGEDIGRHNAFDKAIGKILLKDKLDKVYFAICSSRLSFEMVQKGARLGIEILGGFSAPTSLAVEVAEMWGITLVGFLRKKRFNIYSCPSRILF